MFRSGKEHFSVEKYATYQCVFLFNKYVYRKMCFLFVCLPVCTLIRTK